MRTRLPALLAALLATTAGCGDDDDRDDEDDDDGGEVVEPVLCESLAPVMSECDPSQTQEEWLELCAITVLTQDCLQAIAGAPCEEHAMTTPSYQSTCFPPCSAATMPAACGAEDTITRCVDGFGQVTYRCGPVCEVNDATYTGACGPEYEGRQSETGEDVCWCR